MNALVLHQLLLAVGLHAITNILPAQRFTTTAFMERKCLGTLFLSRISVLFFSYSIYAFQSLCLGPYMIVFAYLLFLLPCFTTPSIHI